MFGKASIFAFCLGCIFISACVVSQDRYFEIEDKLTETQAQLAGDKQSLADLQIRNYELNAKIRNLENRLEKAKRDIDDVGGKKQISNIKASQEILLKIYVELEDKLRKEIESGDIQVEQTDGKQGKLKITFGNKMLFEKGTAEFYEIRGKSPLSLLNNLAELLEKREDVEVMVEGHTDASKMKKGSLNFPSNWELSAARAAAVVRYLDEQGIHSENLTASGRASSAPISPKGKFDDANRRVEIYILPKP